MALYFLAFGHCAGGANETCMYKHVEHVRSQHVAILVSHMPGRLSLRATLSTVRYSTARRHAPHTEQ
jgi:hypothetical protein